VQNAAHERNVLVSYQRGHTVELRDRCIHAVVRDNGRGITEEEALTRLGLVGMRERALTLGGVAVIENIPGGARESPSRFPSSYSSYSAEPWTQMKDWMSIMSCGSRSALSSAIRSAKLSREAYVGHAGFDS